MTIEEDDSSTELLLDTLVSSLLDDASLSLLLDTLVSLELDCGVTLDEDSSSTELLLGTLDDEDFAFSLLLELDEGLDPADEPAELSWLSPLRMTEDEDSTPGSSFGPVEDEESSPQAANNKAAAPIATRNFFIKPPVNQSKCNLFSSQNAKRKCFSYTLHNTEILWPHQSQSNLNQVSPLT